MLERCGLQVAREPQHTVRTTPQDFERLFPATGGALYGRASHGWMASFGLAGVLGSLDLLLFERLDHTTQKVSGSEQWPTANRNMFTRYGTAST